LTTSGLFITKLPHMRRDKRWDARLGQRDAWSYDAEAMYQFGEFGSGKIRAWRVAADNAYTFSAVRWHPRIGFATDIASGDRDPADPDLQTFNALFQSGTYSGRAQILGPDKAIRLEPSIGLLLSKNLREGLISNWREHEIESSLPWKRLVGKNLF
jgi:hypothetical protein